MSLSLDIYKIFQSHWVSVSTSVKFPSLNESESRHLWKCSVSMSLGPDICKISQSFWVSVSTSIEFFRLDESRPQQIFRYQSQNKFTGLFLYSLDNSCFSLNVFEVFASVSTHTFSVSSLRLRPFQSRSRHWDSDLFSLSLGLVIDTQTVSISVLSLRLRHFQTRSRCQWSKSGLVDSCPQLYSLKTQWKLVSMIFT